MILEGDAGGAHTLPDTRVAVAPAPAAPAPAAERALAGRTIAGRYDLLALLGAGGMGAVYRAHDRELDELVAFKVIKAELARQPAMVDRFRHEVKLARRVTHVNIARTFELGNADGVVYCTMELIEGESLHRRLERENRLAVTDAAAIAGELCDGLVAAHAAGVIHRDLKPDNVLLAHDGRVVLADFGVASVATGGHTGELTGTPAYMAPEQARGEPATPATDVYSTGVLLFEMLTGLRAFTGDLADILMAKQDIERLGVPPGTVPRDLAHVIGRATARDPADRIASAAELRRLLAPWIGSALSLAPPLRRPAEADDLRTIVVVPPSGHDERIHLAEGVHEELLRRLVRRPRMRVLPRADGVRVPGATTVELYAGELLSATIRRDRAQTTLHLPLDIASLGPAADAIASAVAEVAGSQRAGPADPAARALEILLRARMLAQRSSFSGVRPAFELLEQAHALCPEDARISATRAMLGVRAVVLGPGGADFERAGELVRAALASAPELAESHVAAGHLELHTGDPAVAASHFRRAIACSPYVAEAHEALGRMLIEAGFLDVGMDRLQDALAIAPNLSMARWDIARAHALEQDWSAYEALEAELGMQRDRAIARMRIAWWRGDLEGMAAAMNQLDEVRTFEPSMLTRLRAVVLDGAWEAERETIFDLVLGDTSTSLRRRAFLAQLGAEVAGWVGDVRGCNAMLERAVACGLFDLHWVDRCPLLEPARRTAEGAVARELVKQRAEAILDAMYGDGEARSDTIAV